MTKRSVVLKSHPSGEPKDSDFEVKEQDVGDLADGKVRIEPTHFSVDPYLRGKMSGKTDAYFVPFKLGEPIDSIGAGKIVESKSDKYKVGDLVAAGFEWASVVDVKPDGDFFQKIQPGVEPETALSVLGLTGLTAYYGLLHIGKLDDKKAGSTVFVSGAAGATGNVVGQIAKIKGYRVIATAGSDDKVAWLKNELHFDEVINYKTVSNIKEALKAAAPDGIDLYFDNVGGEIFDAAIEIMNNHGVIVCCGAISGYNAKEELTGPRVEWRIITKSLRIQGFLLHDFFKDAKGVDTASKELFGWVKEGKLKVQVTLFDDVSGVEGIYKGFIRMMKGDNTGKSIVKI